MKITDVKAMVLSYELKDPIMDSRLCIRAREAVLVEVTTDEGITGMGESMCAGGPPSVTKAIIEEEVKRYCLGENPFRVERLWEKFYQGSMQHGRKGALIAAYSGVDIAIWDIVGKALDMPVYMLLGGFRTKMKAYASGGFYQEGKGVDELIDEVSNYVKEGFKAVKIKIGRLSMKGDMERIKAVREAIGDDVDLMVDANNAYTPFTAIKVGKE
ncbi:TPA: mandelate racemase/muconate lactonizing enzyme family protein, partial [Candidatus Bathyarchaeota archaeon]|nr:mandelate racemase/muconate lactonizing enzyme family protein [Candidatus Bathyarchaeota archaeon]